MSDASGRDVVAVPVLPARTETDPHAFASLYMRHRWSFAAQARRFLADERDVDEVVQEAFLKLFLALPELETELQVLAYARRTIQNLCIDRYRAERRRPNLVDLDAVPMDVLVEEDDEDPIVAAEDAAFVREALALLSPLHREALIKREVEEKALPQIAAELDIPAEHVKHVLHRARKALRRLLVGTHVEPGVDLDLAAVLAANRKRAAAVATPTGAAVLALLLVLAGVLGIRSRGTGTAGTATELPPVGGLSGLLDAQPNHGTVGALPAQRPAAPLSGTTSQPAHRPAHVTHPSATPPKVVPATGSGASTAGPAAPVVPPKAPAPAPAPARPSHLALDGLLTATSAPTLQGGETFTHGTGSTAAFSRFVAPTTEGPVVVAQTVSTDATGSLTYVADASLPVAGMSVPAELGAPQQNAVRNADGTVAVTLSTQFSLPVAADGGLPQTDRFVVQALYTPDLSSVLAERVVVGGPNDPIAPLATPTASVVDGGSAVPPDGATVPPAPPATNVSSGQQLPAGRDQEPLPSS